MVATYPPKMWRHIPQGKEKIMAEMLMHILAFILVAFAGLAVAALVYQLLRSVREFGEGYSGVDEHSSLHTI